MMMLMMRVVVVGVIHLKTYNSCSTGVTETTAAHSAHLHLVGSVTSSRCLSEYHIMDMLAFPDPGVSI